MRYTSLLLLAFLVSIFAPQAHAKDGIQVSPAFLEVDITKPGERKEVSVQVTNKTAREVTLDIYPLDFRQKDEFGSIGFLGLDNSYSYSLSSFLSFATRQLILKPGETRDIVATITNRDDLSPGGHYAAVVAKEASSKERVDDMTSVSPSIAALLLIHKVGGERFNASVINSSWPDGWSALSYKKFFNLTIQNEGNIHITPYGRVEVRDMFGRLLSDGIINPGSLIVLPESRRIIDVIMTPLVWSLPLSVNTLKVRGNDSLHKITYEYQTTFLYIDPLVVGAVAVFAIGMIFLVHKRRK
ncbi:MAG: hypothetical protein KBC15_03025 [Candidatus Levybacteria bacterium]|nr:hypothetical protein [Candidatus Levybacteria bacterium]